MPVDIYSFFSYRECPGIIVFQKLYFLRLHSCFAMRLLVSDLFTLENPFEHLNFLGEKNAGLM